MDWGHLITFVLGVLVACAVMWTRLQVRCTHALEQLDAERKRMLDTMLHIQEGVNAGARIMDEALSTFILFTQPYVQEPKSELLNEEPIENVLNFLPREHRKDE